MIAYKGFEKNLSCRGYHFNDMGSMRQRKQIADRMDSIVRKIHWIVLFTIRIGGTLGIL